VLDSQALPAPDVGDCQEAEPAPVNQVVGHDIHRRALVAADGRGHRSPTPAVHGALAPLPPEPLRARPRAGAFQYQSILAERSSHLRFASTLLPEEESRAWALMRRLERIRSAPDRAFLARTFDSLLRNWGSLLLRLDRLGMAASIEMRVPYLCKEVADAALHLPASAKLRDGAVGDRLRWSRATTEELIPRIERNVVLRSRLSGLELWLRVQRGESPDALADRLLAIPAS
jgi:hypothetical protein